MNQQENNIFKLTGINKSDILNIMRSVILLWTYRII